MIEKTLKTTTGKLRVKIPTHLNEVSLGQMIAMQEKPHLSDLDAISILSGIAVEELKNVCNIQDFDRFGEAIISLSNQIKYLYNSDDIPQTVTFIIGNKKIVIKVISNLSVEPAGAFMAARDIIADEINKHINLHGQEDWEAYFNPSLTACCHVLAHYFFCKATGKKYSEYEVEGFCEIVKALRVTEALPIAM